MENNNFDIKAQIEASESDESIENSIINQLQVADDIMKDVENIPELKAKFQKEYDELKLSIDGAIQTNNEVTSSEFNKIIQEFLDIQSFYISNIGTPLKVEKEKLNGFENKPIYEYSKEEALIGLKYIQNNFTDYKDNNQFSDSIDDYSINMLENEIDVLFFQQKLIEKIIGSSGIRTDGYTTLGGGLILCVDKKIGHSVMNANEFKNKLNKIKKLNDISFSELDNYKKLIEGFEERLGNTETPLSEDILKKYFPEHLLKDFYTNYSKANEKQLFRKGKDETEIGEYDILYNMTGDNHILAMKLTQAGKSKKEIIKILFKTNNKLKTELTTYKEKHKEYYEEKARREEEEDDDDEEALKQNNQEYTQQPEVNNKIFTNYDGAKYNTESGIVTLRNSRGEIKLSKEERKIVESDPSKLDNIIDFYDFYDEINMSSVFKYRAELSDSMDDVFINSEDSNSMSKNELIKFSNNLIKFLNNIPSENGENRPQLSSSDTLGGIRNQLRIYSGANSDFSDEATSNTYGEDRFASDLRRLGIIGNSLGFQKNKFRDISKGDKKETV